MKKVRKSVPVTQGMSYELKQVATRLNISQANLIVISIEMMLSSIKKNTVSLSDLVKYVINNDK
jgi:hypothetical protein